MQKMLIICIGAFYALMSSVSPDSMSEETLIIDETFIEAPICPPPGGGVIDLYTGIVDHSITIFSKSDDDLTYRVTTLSGSSIRSGSLSPGNNVKIDLPQSKNMFKVSANNGKKSVMKVVKFD